MTDDQNKSFPKSKKRAGKTRTITKIMRLTPEEWGKIQEKMDDGGGRVGGCVHGGHGRGLPAVPGSTVEADSSEREALPEREGRPSEVKLNRVIRVRPEQMRREGAIMPQGTFKQIQDAYTHHNG